MVDAVRERHDVLGQPAGGDRLRVGAELLAQPADDPVDLAGEAVDDPERIASTVDLPISERGGTRSIFGSLAPRSVSASIEISTPGVMMPPRYSPAAPTTS